MSSDRIKKLACREHPHMTYGQGLEAHKDRGVICPVCGDAENLQWRISDPWQQPVITITWEELTTL